MFSAATGLYRVTEEPSPPAKHKFNPSPFVVKMPSSSEILNIQVSQSSPAIGAKKHKFSFGGANPQVEQECRSRTHGSPLLRSKGEGSPVSLSHAAFEYLLQSSQRQNNFAIATILRNLSSSDKSQKKQQLTTFSNSSKGGNNAASPPVTQQEVQWSPENPFKVDTLASPITPVAKPIAEKENQPSDLKPRVDKPKHEPVIVKT